MACVGIRMGTTNAYMALLPDSSDYITHSMNSVGNPHTEVCVLLTETGEFIAGSQAFREGVVDPTRLVTNFIPLIGKPFSKIPSEFRTLDPRIVDLGKDVAGYRFANGKTIPVSSCLTLMFAALFQDAISFVGSSDIDAVVTVSTTSTDPERQAMKDSATQAGFRVLRIINDATAACIAYALDKDNARSNVVKEVAVIHIGQYHTQIDILEIDDGVYEIKGTKNTLAFTGTEIDKILVKNCVEKFNKSNKVDVTQNARAMRRLERMCKQGKTTLTNSASTRIEVDSIHNGLDMEVQITRAYLESGVTPLIQANLKPLIAGVLSMVSMSPEHITDVVFAGGCSKIPCIKQFLINFFPKATAHYTINPESVVSEGAAIQCGILSSGHPSHTVHTPSVAQLIPPPPTALSVSAPPPQVTNSSASTLEQERAALVQQCSVLENDIRASSFGEDERIAIRYQLSSLRNSIAHIDLRLSGWRVSEDPKLELERRELINCIRAKRLEMGQVAAEAERIAIRQEITMFQTAVSNLDKRIGS
eukprot:PhF_6_TR6953/c0_g1_i1/m.10222/K03283/HSPA1s; heat shock 70kDa protein 1/2/6/8